MLKKEEIKKIAHLSRLSLDGKEIEKYSKQLSSIIDYFELLQEIDTKDVEIAMNGFEIKNVFRKDEEKESKEREGILKCPSVPTKKDLFVAKSVF